MRPPQTLQKTLYTAVATTIGGRNGKVTTDDEKLRFDLSIPKEMGGAGGAGTNPEQLFAAGYSACFGSAVEHIARTQKLSTGPVRITAKVGIGPISQGFGLAVELVAAIPELPRDQAEALIRAAHEICPYSNATRGNIEVQLRLG